MTVPTVVEAMTDFQIVFMKLLKKIAIKLDFNGVLFVINLGNLDNKQKQIHIKQYLVISQFEINTYHYKLILDIDTYQ